MTDSDERQSRYEHFQRFAPAGIAVAAEVTAMVLAGVLAFSATYYGRTDLASFAINFALGAGLSRLGRRTLRLERAVMERTP